MKILLFANTDWYLFNFRRSLAMALRAEGHDVLLVSPPGPYAVRLVEMGLRWISVPMERRSLNPMRELRLLWRLRALMMAERPDLIHGFTIKPAIYGALAARASGVAATVSSIAGLGYVFTSDDLKARLLRPLVRALMRSTLDASNARLILQNPDDVEMFKRARLVDADHIRLVLGSGVDCVRFAPSPRRLKDAGDRRFRVVLPARLLWDKGVREYVDAARLIRAQGRAMDFLLAGDPDPGNPASVPEETLRDWVDHGLVQWLGHLEDMPALLGDVDAVVLPSYREGLPKCLIEAGACGLPMVTTDVPGCRAVVTHEVDGLLVPVKDADALAAALIRLLDDVELRKRISLAARKRALAEFDERIVIRKTLSVYAELLPKAAMRPDPDVSDVSPMHTHID